MGEGNLYGVAADSNNPYKIKFDYDTTSLLIATAVNMGIIPIAKLTRVLIHTTEERYGDRAQSYTHPFHPAMTPILCLTAGTPYVDANGNQQTIPADCCVVVSDNSSAFYPFMTGIDGDDNACTCDSSDTYCNTGAVRMSLLFAKDDSTYIYDIVSTMGTLIKNDPINGDKEQQSRINALYTSCPISEADPATGSTTGNEACNSAWIAAVGPTAADHIGMFTLLVYPQGNRYFTLNALPLKELQYTTAAAQGCKNTIYNPAAFSALQAEVPVPLAQPYYSCSSTPYNAVKAEIGNSYGFVMLFVNIFCLTTLVLIIAWDRMEKHHVAFKPDDDDNIGAAAAAASADGKKRSGSSAAIELTDFAPSDRDRDREKENKNWPSNPLKDSSSTVNPMMQL